MSEKKILNHIQIDQTKRGNRMFRNNTGKGWVGESQFFKERSSVLVFPGDVVIRKARRLNAGLCVGSSDLIGWTTKIISKDMVGKRVAIFTADEVKTPGVPVTEQQKKFLDAVEKSGGIASISGQPSDLVSAQEEWG